VRGDSYVLDCPDLIQTTMKGREEKRGREAERLLLPWLAYKNLATKVAFDFTRPFGVFPWRLQP